MKLSFRESNINGLTRQVLCCLLAFFAVQQVFAQTTPGQQALPPDVRLVIDVSGSMKANDPNNLRQPAVELLVQLLPENSKAGIWTFGKWVNMLVPHREVNLQWRESAQQQSSAINSVGLFTNIGDALEKAAYDHTQDAQTHRRHIILLTDGMVDIDKDPEVNHKEWRRIVDEVLPKLSDAGFTIHTIALSDNADSNLLGKLSLTTDGIAEIAHSADDLMKAFLKAFDVAAQAEQVPLKDNRFVIDSSIEEFTALIFRQNPQETTELVGPDASVVRAKQATDGVKWHTTATYDLITVDKPLEGEWLIKADMAPESRITVISNLNLRVKPLPNNVYKGQSLDLQFALVEDGKIIKRKEFLSLMKIDVSMQAGVDETDLRPVWSENLAREEPPTSGTWHQRLPDFDRNGIYDVNIFVDGQTFERKFSHRLTVRQPFAAEVTEEFNSGRLDYVLSVKSFGNEVEVLKTEVIASVTVPGGNKKFIPLGLTDMDTWRGKFEPTAEGEYLVEVRIKGQTKNGETFDVLLDNLSARYSLDEGMVATPQSFFPSSVAEVTTPAAEQKEPEQKPLEKKPEPAVEQVQPATGEKTIPAWLLYGALGLGNLLLLGFGFLGYKKLTRTETDDEILNEFSDEKIAEKRREAAEDPSVKTESEQVVSVKSPPADEPPMEDLEPAMEDLSDSPDDEPPMEEIDMPPGESDEPDEDTSIDDLDQMSIAEELSASGDADEDDDMVNAMLKAQGLDLAEDELDDAISSLIDEMEADADEDKDKDKDKEKNKK